MSNGNGPWTKFQSDSTSGETGPWVKFAAPKKDGDLLTESQKQLVSEVKRSASSDPATSIGPRKKGISSWLEDLEADVRTGTGATLPGRILKKMGAPGLEMGQSKEVGEFMGSPLLGPIHAAQGVAMLPQHPWEGTKKAVGGMFEAGTIPGLLAAAPEEGGAAAMGKMESFVKDVMSARKAGKTIQEWKKINKAIGVTSKGVRIGEGAKSIEEAATMPGRTLERAGFTAKKLEKMKPLERMMAIRPHLEQAGQRIDQLLDAQEKAGKTLDVGAKVFETLKKIPNPKIQEQAIESFNYLAKELGIANQRAATPREAWKLRRALVAGSRFGQGGDLNSLANVRGALYGAVSSDLKAAVPGLSEADQAYSDLRTAMNAARSTVQKESVKGPKPGLLKSIARGAKKEFTERPIRTTALAVGIPYVGSEVAKHFSSPVP
jgi:hypothetical protein